MKKRVLYFDVLKAISIVLVVLIHVISEYWSKLDVNSSGFIILTILDSLCRFCVPVYFMVSGALFLNEEKEITIKDILKKYVPRILLVFIFWNLLYGVLNTIIISKKVITFKLVFDLIIKTLLGKGLYHLWFLPVIIGFYLCVPLIKQITKKENKELLKYLIIILFFLISFNTIFSYIFDYEIYYPIIFGGYLIYFIIGYYINTFEISKRNKRIIYILGILGLIITMLGTILCSIGFGITEVFFKYYTFNVILYSSAIFLFAKDHFNKEVPNILIKTNFGIYLIHGLVLGFLEKLDMFYTFDKLTIGVSVILSAVVIFLVSLFGTFILLHIPIVKNLVSLDRKK